MARERVLFRLFGLPVKASGSWLFLVALVIYSLWQGYFPQQLGPSASWQLNLALSVVGTVGLFASLIAHEMCHSLVARATGMPVAGITLFIFGGVSQLEDEPSTALSEFFMAIVGPLSSVLIGVGFLAVWFVARLWHFPVALLALARYLAMINFVLAAFNSLPAFPLDGGRVLRSVVWAVTDNLRVATRFAATIGSAFGILMIVAGFFTIMTTPGIQIGGIWLIVLGFFLRQAAMGSLQMVILRHNLQGNRVRRFMTMNLVTVPQDLDVQRFVDEYVFHHRFNYYPVVDDDGLLVGLIGSRAPRRVPPERWPVTPVSELMRRADENLILDPDTDAVDALAALRPLDEHRAVVVENGRPVGIVSLSDLLEFLALKIDLTPRRRLR